MNGVARSDEIVAPDCIEHQTGAQGTGPEAVRRIAARLRASFPDLKLPVEDIAAVYDKVWAGARTRGTDTGGVALRPPSGKTIEVDVIDVVRFRDGRMVEHWGLASRLGMLQQVSVVPLPQQERRVARHAGDAEGGGPGDTERPVALSHERSSSSVVITVPLSVGLASGRGRTGAMPEGARDVGTEGAASGQPVVELPDDLPDGRDLIAEGRARGSQVEVVPSAFCELHGVRSEAQFKAARAEAGELTWSMIMGQASVDEQVEGLRYLHELGSGSGYVIDRGMVIPDWTSALPPDVRDKAPRGTSFVLDGVADHVRIAQAAPISPAFCDWHIGSPYCVENTLAAVAAGGSYHGVFAQYAWDMPLVKDDVARLFETITSLGVIASRRDEWLVVDSYMDDGMPSHFVDNASLVGYALLEKYVVDELCGARYATGFGGLISDIPTKVAVWLALNEVLKADHPCLSYLYGNTISPSDTYLAQNFGVIAPEMAVFAAVEKRYRTGVSFLPTPITEKIEVPTPEAIGEARMAAGKAAERAAEFDKLIDWPVVESMRDVLVENGWLFFRNALAVLAQSGVDMRDPLQVLLAIRRVGAHKLEELCHPGERDPLRPGGIVPFVPTELLTMAQQMAMAELATVRSRGLESAVRGRRFIVASADTHWYGAFALKTVLEELGAIVVDAGAECDPEELVEIARQDPCAALAVSTHNGQCLSYGRSLTELLRLNGLSCPVFIGGKLNAILEGDSEPSDMCGHLREIGVVPCVSVADLVEEAVKAGQQVTARN